MIRVWLQFVSLVLIWGTTWLAIKLQLTQVPFAWSVVYRFAGASAVLVLVAELSGTSLRITFPQHRRIAAFGLFQFFGNFIFVYAAERLISSGLMAIVMALLVFFNPFFGWVAYRTPLRPLMLAGGVLAVIGVALMFSHEIKNFSLADNGTRGLLLALSGMLSASIATTIVTASSLRGLPAMTVTVWGMFYGTLASSLFAGLTAGPPTFSLSLHYILPLLFLILFGSVVAFSFYVNVMRKLGVARAAYVSVLVPVIALSWSTALEHFQWTWLAISGALLAMGGTLIAVRGK